jgi:redox-sensitive bicupin YhaK (pirin superfamily)
MFSAQSPATFNNPAHTQNVSIVTAGTRRIALLTNGRRHGPVTRLITPWGVGELTRPFVLLSYAEPARRSRSLFGVHPPSGITALTVVLSGKLLLEDASGEEHKVAAPGFAWTRTGSVAWHEGGPPSSEPLRAFQLWISQLAPEQRAAAAPSEYVEPDEVEQDGPVRVFLGQFGRARSRLRHAPVGVNCFHVRLEDGERFRYAAPDRHNVTWLAVDRGSLHLRAGEQVQWEQFALFGDTAGVIEAQATGETSFVVGSATRSS